MRKNFNFLLAKQAMKEKGVTQQDLADYLTNNGIPTPIDTIKSWFRSDEKNRSVPELLRIKLIGEFLNLDANQMILGFEKFAVKKVQIVGFASCGSPIVSDYSADEGVFLSAEYYKPSLYALRACGDSMMPEIFDGDIVICDPTVDITNGDLVHYTLFGESAIKVFAKDKIGIIKLIPLNQNPHFLTLNITPDDSDMLDNFKMAKVTQIIKTNINNRKARLKLLGLN